MPPTINPVTPLTKRKIPLKPVLSNKVKVSDNNTVDSMQITIRKEPKKNNVSNRMLSIFSFNIVSTTAPNNKNE